MAFDEKMKYRLDDLSRFRVALKDDEAKSSQPTTVFSDFVTYDVIGIELSEQTLEWVTEAIKIYLREANVR